MILSLPNNAIVMTQETGVTVDETLFVWEIAQPHWIDVEALELTTDDHTVIDSTHPAHDHLTFGIQDQSGLYLDADEDGELSADERDAGTLASGDDRDADGDANDTEDDNSERGCNAVGGVPAWLLLAMAPLLRRRTRDSTR